MAAADRLTRAAAADRATLIVLPEKWTALGNDEDLRAAAEPLDGPAVAWARAIARELSIDLIAGSFVERTGIGEGPGSSASGRLRHPHGDSQQKHRHNPPHAHPP